MRKRVATLLSVVFLMLMLSPVFLQTTTVSAAVGYVVMNDEIHDGTSIYVAGVTYVPCTVFKWRQLGVSYSYNASTGKIILNRNQRFLEYDIEKGDEFTQRNEYQGQAVVRNGEPYVPASAVCRYLGLNVSFLYAESGSYQIARIKNGEEVLSDQVFMQIVANDLERESSYINGPQGSGENNTHTVNPSAPEAGVPSTPGGESAVQGGTDPLDDPEELGQGASVYLGISMRDGQDLEKTADVLYRNSHAKGIFFFQTDQLAAQGDFLRKLCTQGHRIGLIPRGDTLEGKILDIEEANRLLGHILRTSTVFVLADDQGEAMRKGLSDAGYIPWKPDTSVNGGMSVQAALSQIEAQSGKGKVLLKDGIEPTLLSDILQKLREGRSKVQMPRETSD